MIYAIPFTSIIEQNAEQFRKVFSSFDGNLDELILEHHSNFDPNLETVSSRLASENWDAPLVVTTNVQLFESLCVPGMGKILWGASPLYIFQEGDKESTLKSTSRRQGRVGDRSSERQIYCSCNICISTIHGGKAGVQTCELTNRNRI